MKPIDDFPNASKSSASDFSKEPWPSRRYGAGDGEDGDGGGLRGGSGDDLRLGSRDAPPLADDVPFPSEAFPREEDLQDADDEFEPSHPLRRRRSALASDDDELRLLDDLALGLAEPEPALPSTAPPAKEVESKPSPPRQRSGLLEALALVCVAFALALTLKTYVAEAYEIKGRSMEPSFHNGERVVVLKTLFSVGRGDVIVFASPEDPGKDLIKRVVGLPGDAVEIRNGQVYLNGELFHEDYITPPTYYHERAIDETVPTDSFYVLGDNRPDSHDSRSFDAVSVQNVKGKVVVRWWPLKDFSTFGD